MLNIEGKFLTLSQYNMQKLCQRIIILLLRVLLGQKSNQGLYLP